ncbi:hypothetical protein MMC06_004122 [Schaereria dolodes]|nr:hypothetical protein [Schaereria dolodes]
MRYRLGRLLAAAGLLRPIVASLQMNSVMVSTSTIIVPTGRCTASSTNLVLSSSPVVVPYTTTNSLGSTIITSSTSYYSIPPLSVSSETVLITTTNSAGSTITTSIITVVPVPSTSASTSVVVLTTTNLSGSTITTSTTSTISPSSSEIVVASGSPSPCPTLNNTLYTDAQGKQYDIFCNTDYSYGDLAAVSVTSFAACLVACSSYMSSPSVFSGQGCVAVSWDVNINPNGGNCYLKYSITNIQYGNPLYDSAKLHSYTPSGPSISTESISSAATAISASSSTIATGTSSTISSAVSTSTSYPCPASVGGVYQNSDGSTYEIFCGTDFEYNDLAAVSTSSFGACIAACSAYVPSASVFDGQSCVAVTWVGPNPNGANCYLKYSISQVVYGTSNYDSARLVSYNPSSIAVSVLSSTTSSTSIGTSATSTGASTTSGIYGYSSVSSSSSSSIGGYGSNSVSSSSSTISASGSSSSIQPASSSYPCPASNGTLYTDSENQSYNLYCGANLEYSDLPSVTVDSFEACIFACDNYVANASVFGGQSCTAVTYVGPNPNGGNCYLKYAITDVVYGTNYDSAARVGNILPGQSSSSTINGYSSTSISSSASSSLLGYTSTSTSLSTSTGTSSSTIIPYGGSTTTSSTSTTSFGTSTSISSSTINPYGGSSTTSTLSTLSPTSTSTSSSSSTTSSTSSTSSFTSTSTSSSTLTTSSTSSTSLLASTSTSSSSIPISSTTSSTSTTSTSTSTSTSSTTITTSSSSATSSTTIPNSYGGVTTSTTSTSSSTTTTSTTIESGYGTSTSSTGGATTTPDAPVCPGANNTVYTDPAGSSYDIKCGLDINSTATPISAVHADNQGDCVEYCDITGDCAAITWDVTITGAGQTNCFPFSQVQNYFSSALTELYSAVLVDGGTTSASYDNITAICPTYNNTDYIDPLGFRYSIGCNQNYAGFDGAPAQTDSLEACLEYCDDYSVCEGVDWVSGLEPLSENEYNCYPKQSFSDSGPSYQQQTTFAVRLT